MAMKPVKAIPDRCMACEGEGRVRKVVDGDVKEKVCPRCHGSGVEPGPRPSGYGTK
jgi:DnaJ-class molecular chaperone